MVLNGHAHDRSSSPRSCSTSPPSSPRSSSSCSSTRPTSRVRPRSTSCRSCWRPSRACPSGPTPSTCPRSPATSSSTTCPSATRQDRLSCTTSRSTSRRARRSRSSARPAPASRRSPSSSPASTTRPEGTVSIDGHDLRDVTLESLRRQLGVVPQEPFLFAGSVRDNVDVRPSRRHRRGSRRGLPRRRPGRADRSAPPGPRHPRPRARRDALVGRAPAARAGPRVPRPAHVCSCSTRPPRTSTCAVRRRSSAALDAAARGPHRDPDRPPSGDSDARRPDRRGRRRRGRRARVARRSCSLRAGSTPRCSRPGNGT